MAGKCRVLASRSSSAQKTLTILSVFWVTGSLKSPPEGDTAPMTDMDPVGPASVLTRPHLS